MKKVILHTHVHNSLHAIIDFALLLARDLEKELEVIHIVDTRSISYSSGGIEPTVESGQMLNYDILNQQKEGMEKTLHETINERKEVLNADLPVSYNVHIDNPEWLLNAISKKEDTYLMLLPESATEGGLKGYEQYKHLLNDLHCPILLFPDDIKYAPLKKMVVATNYQKEDIRILDKLRDLAKHYQSKVLTLHVNEGEAFEYQLKEKGFEQILEEKVDYPDINFKAIDHDEAEKAIGEFSERIQADLLVLHKGHRNIFEKLFSKSRARKIIEKVHMPVLVFNDHTLEKGT